ncbi:two-component regulator propeller domain-containing protein [uncultured Dokdonia sp.]|uniref:helix-turn-helix and ligand-binding sensor domain-containing protein n=1 Tax=uncultured Dokdonia sp. TaxID=575653 RepID=UPI00261CF109|nr:two-component regulator propeller domain-containing protein [uncultured Dokdonia sp.]
MTQYIIRISFLLFFFAFAKAQELPPVVNYPPSVYDADNQNWMLTQGPDKTIFVANNRGLLTFNGAQWDLYPSPNRTIVRAVKAVSDKVYTGAYMDFGVWEKEVTGVLKYTSIIANLHIEMIEDEHIWNIESYGQYVLFQSLDRIYIYDTVGRQVQVVTPNAQITRLFLVGDDLLFQVKGEGLYTIQKGKPVLYNSSSVLAQERLINLFQIDGKLIGITANDGFYVIDEQQATSWEVLSNESIKKYTVYSAIQRKNKSIVLGTIENGIIQLSKDGVFQYQIKQGNGLNNNTALTLLEDKDQNLWVGLDAGIDCINSQSPFHQYIDVSGELGTIYASATINGYMYLGTNQGLFYKPETSQSDFVRMPGTEGQVWSLRIIDGVLFCGHNNGTYIIEKSSQQLIATIEGTWDIKQIPTHKNLLLQGNYDGLYVLERADSGWRVRNKIQNFVNSSKHFEIIDADEILVNHEYKGVFEIKVDDEYQEATEVFKHTSVNIGEHSSLSRLDNAVFYANKEGVFVYDSENQKFVINQKLSLIFNDDTFVTGKLIEDQNKLWAFTKDNLISISSDKLDGAYSIKKIPIPISLRNTVEGYESFVNIRENEYLLGTSNGYIVVNTSDAYTEVQDYKINLKSVSVHSLGNESRLISYDDEVEFSSRDNNLSFSYSVPEYDKFHTTEYSYLLEGLYDVWSPWTTNSNIHFENLPHNSYTFKAKARVGGEETSNELIYSFSIERPWYLSNLSIILYVILTVFLFILLNWFYKRYYRKQQELALERTKKDMELKALESEKQIVELNNANLKQDIDARNRELAVSTMNMVNKNKTLNAIKNALLKAEKIEDINKIVSLVDKTIENEEDWNFFEEAFNHADKDFFRKVKEKHPSLTANDLKLCVYLRLNMSSKEIAPLLNISSRSVEIKRYRLRKKLDLSRDVNLNDYFINL